MADILVTGATGQIGRRLIGELIQAKAAVRALVRDTGEARRILGEGVELAPGDLRDPGALDQAMAGVSTLHLLSSDPGLETQAVEAARRNGLRRIVKSSAIGFGAEPPPGHRQIERTIETTGIDHVFLRPNAFMSTLADYLPRLADEDGRIELPAGDGRTAWIDPGDIARAAAAALLDDHRSGVFLLSGPEALGMAEVADCFATATGRPFHYVPVSPERARARLERRGLGQMAAFLVTHYSAVAEGGFGRITEDVRRLTGRPPRTLAEFLATRLPETIDVRPRETHA